MFSIHSTISYDFIFISHHCSAYLVKTTQKRGKEIKNEARKPGLDNQNNKLSLSLVCHLTDLVIYFTPMQFSKQKPDFSYYNYGQMEPA